MYLIKYGTIYFYTNMFMYNQCRLNVWARWAVTRGPHANLGMLCMTCYLMFKHWVCWKYQYNRYMFNFVDHLHCYACVGRAPSALFCLGAYNAVKTALYTISITEQLFLDLSSNMSVYLMENLKTTKEKKWKMKNKIFEEDFKKIKLTVFRI